jgi:beta-galactosidase GanA
MKYRNILTPVLLFCASSIYAQDNNSHVEIKKENGCSQLLVQGKPFLVLGGELGNSSTSSVAYMKTIWPKLKSMQLNTVLAPVYWELMEPAEGKFDFALVDSMIQQARRSNLKLVLLWFGTWKNSMSCYAPAWAKTSLERFERAKDSKGKNLEIFSAFSKNNLDADIKAFSALMKHIRVVDGKTNTVLMIQVENEIGMLTEAREYTSDANLAFSKPVPDELMGFLAANKEKLVPEFSKVWQKNGFLAKGTWEEVFGKGLGTDEIFQAWQYAVFSNAVAAAGKKEYALPMFVNAALNYKNVQPGEYPSAGPLPHLMDVWMAGAPAVDFMSPDFYNPYFRRFSDDYVRRGNPFFIPEIRSDANNAAKVFYAIGHYKAFGFSPFSIESTTTPLDEPIAKSYALLKQIAPLILEYQPKGKVEAVLLDSLNQKQDVVLGDYKLTVKHDHTLSWSPGAKKPNWPETGGIIIQTAPDEFIIAGTGIVVTFSTLADNGKTVGILQADEGVFEKGKWVPGRRMNGDQDHQGRHIGIDAKEFAIQKVRIYEY